VGRRSYCGGSVWKLGLIASFLRGEFLLLVFSVYIFIGVFLSSSYVDWKSYRVLLATNTPNI